MKRDVALVLLAALAATPACSSGENLDDHVAGDLVVFNDNGAWCWYQDQRAIVDPENGKLLVGSVAVSEGIDGKERGGDVDVVSYDPANGALHRFTLGNLREDDHDAPALLIRPDGRYLAMYTAHNRDKLSRYRISTQPHDATSWEDERAFDWHDIGSDFRVTYSNLVYLSAEDRVYDFARADGRSPNVLMSEDQGTTWSYGGAIARSGNVGYVNGYFKYASDGVDRVDFIGTEHHPRDYDTSVYHGYLRGGQLHGSGDEILDTDLLDDAPLAPSDFTTVFAADTKLNGEAMTHVWISDLRQDRDGNPRAILTARAHDEPENTNFDDHRFLYARFDGAQWVVHPIAKAGPPLFSTETDYTGLGTMDPTDPDTIYISTPIDPRDGMTTTLAHEIYKGMTHDGGASWSWTPITERSTHHNIRPVVPQWDDHHTAILWLRGKMRRSQDYHMAVVGIIEER